MSINPLNIQNTNPPQFTVDGELNQLFDPQGYTGEIVRRGGVPALLRYLKSPQTYSIATTGATWGLPKEIFGIKVILGHHAMIRLPGRRLCEWADKERRTWEGHLRSMSQLELRTATGKQIESMWRTHCKLIPKYRQWGNLDSSPEGFLHYMPFKNDCFTYVDRVLTENNQAPLQVDRLSPTTYAFGPSS